MADMRLSWQRRFCCLSMFLPLSTPGAPSLCSLVWSHMDTLGDFRETPPSVSVELAVWINGSIRWELPKVEDDDDTADLGLRFSMLTAVVQ